MLTSAWSFQNSRCRARSTEVAEVEEDETYEEEKEGEEEDYVIQS